MSVAKLVAKLGLDGSDFKRGIKDAKSDAKGLDSAFSGLGKGLAIGGGLAALVAIGKVIKDQFKKAMTYLDQVATASDNLGVGAESLQSLVYAGASYNIELDKIEKALTKVKSAQGDIGNAEIATAWRALGVSVDDVARLRPEDLLARIGAGMRDAKTASEAFNAVTAIFGEKIGPKMTAMLQEIGGASLDAYTAKVREAGAIVDEETVKWADSFDTFFNRTGLRARAWIAELAHTIASGDVRTPDWMRPAWATQGQPAVAGDDGQAERERQAAEAQRRIDALNAQGAAAVAKARAMESTEYQKLQEASAKYYALLEQAQRLNSEGKTVEAAIANRDAAESLIELTSARQAYDKIQRQAQAEAAKRFETGDELQRLAILQDEIRKIREENERLYGAADNVEMMAGERRLELERMITEEKKLQDKIAQDDANAALKAKEQQATAAEKWVNWAIQNTTDLEEQARLLERMIEIKRFAGEDVTADEIRLADVRLGRSAASVNVDQLARMGANVFGAAPKAAAAPDAQNKVADIAARQLTQLEETQAEIIKMREAIENQDGSARM